VPRVDSPWLSDELRALRELALRSPPVADIRDPEPPRYLPVSGPGLDHLRRSAASAPGGHAPPQSARRHRDPDDTGITRDNDVRQRQAIVDR